MLEGHWCHSNKLLRGRNLLGAPEKASALTKICTAKNMGRIMLERY